MKTPQQKRAAAEANRRRYEELRAAGQEATRKGLPKATARDGAKIANEAIVRSETVPAGWYAIVTLKRGEALRIKDPSGTASAALIGWRQEEMSERLNCADTAKIQWSAAMTKGRILFSDMGRVFLSLIEDTSGAHDLLMGASTPASMLAAYGMEGLRNSHENFLAAAAKLGLGLRDLHSCITFFAPVSLDKAGRFKWNKARKKAGDFVDLRAEMNAVLVVSNCPHPLDPARPASEAAIELTHYRAPAAKGDDPCRTSSPEAKRAFTFTDRLFA